MLVTAASSKGVRDTYSERGPNVKMAKALIGFTIRNLGLQIRDRVHSNHSFVIRRSHSPYYIQATKIYRVAARLILSYFPLTLSCPLLTPQALVSAGQKPRATGTPPTLDSHSGFLPIPSTGRIGVDPRYLLIPSLHRRKPATIPQPSARNPCNVGGTWYKPESGLQAMLAIDRPAI